MNHNVLNSKSKESQIIKKTQFKRNLIMGKILQVLMSSGSDQNWVIALSGLANTRKTEMLNNLFNLTTNNIGFFSKNNFQSFAFFLTKQTKKNEIHNFIFDPKIVYFRNIRLATRENILQDINQNLIDNLDLNNMKQWKYFKFIKNFFNKQQIFRIYKKITYLTRALASLKTIEQTKSIWPILTTITTIGTSIGTPILSLALLRQDVISNIIGYHGFLAIIIFCVILILSGVLSVLSYLISSVYISRTQQSLANMDEYYVKLIKKYFVIPSKKYLYPLKWYKRSLNPVTIKTHFNYFYDGFNRSDPSFNEMMHLLQIIEMLDNNILFTVNVDYDYQNKQIFDNSWIVNKNLLVWKSNQLKPATNKWILINFILTNLTLSLKTDTHNLYRNNTYFAEIIQALLETADTETDIIGFLVAVKNTYSDIKEWFNDPDGLSYFIQSLPILILKVIEPVSFENLIYHMSFNLSYRLDQPAVETQKKFTNLNVESALNSNWKKFGNWSIIFKTNEIYENYNFKTILKNFKRDQTNLIPIQNQVIKQVNDLLKAKGFEKTSEQQEYQIWNASFYNNPITNENLLLAEMIPIYNLDVAVIKQMNYFDVIHEIKTVAFNHLNLNNEKTKYVILQFVDQYYVLQRNFNDYEIINYF